MTPQDIINAIICYCFLWPVIWLARKNPNFSHPFIQGHARRSTLIFATAWVIWILFIFALWPITHWSIGPFILYDILLFVLVVLFLGVLIWHAFRAYKGEFADEVQFHSIQKLHETTISEMGILSEREKIIIILSFIPFLGIWISSRFPQMMTKQGESISTWALGVILVISIWFHEWYTTGLIVTLWYILFVVTLGVQLFVGGKWIEMHILRLLPEIGELNMKITILYLYSIEIFKMIIWKQNTRSYRDLSEELLSQKESATPSAFLFSPMLIGIPILNIVTIPSFFMERFVLWRHALLQGYLISIFVWLTLYFSWNPLWIVVLLIPSVYLLSYLPSNTSSSSPIIGILANILNTLSFGFFSGKEKIKNLKKTTETVDYYYGKEEETASNR